jgi:hypothetical protein
LEDSSYPANHAENSNASHSQYLPDTAWCSSVLVRVLSVSDRLTAEDRNLLSDPRYEEESFYSGNAGSD